MEHRQATGVPAAGEASSSGGAGRPRRCRRRRTGCGRSRAGPRARPAGRAWPGRRAGRRPVDRVGPRPAAPRTRLGVAVPRQPAAGRRRARAAGARPRSSGSANSLTPVSGPRAVREVLGPRRCQVAASRSATSARVERGQRAAGPLELGEPVPGGARPAASVSDSTYQEPPAGSRTRPRLDSSCRSDWVLRAIRRAEVVRQPERGVERQHGDRVGAADRRRRSRRPWCAACSPTGRGGSSSPPR